jgi:type III pantothenate kinase
MKILAINAGNSRVAAGWCEGGEVVCAAAAERASAGLLRAVAGRGGRPDAVGVASVAPKKDASVARAVAAAFPGVPVVRVRAGSALGIGVDLENPGQTGADRYADAVAGERRFGAPCIVCDFGTATTFNLVLPKRGFCGGAIAPGYGMWFQALARGTALLPELEPGGARLKTGRNTEQAIRLGARWGFRGMVTEILWQLSKACPKGTEPVIAATGGWAELVAKDAGFSMAVVPELTLEGVAVIAERTLARGRSA